MERRIEQRAFKARVVHAFSGLTRSFAELAEWLRLTRPVSRPVDDAFRRVARYWPLAVVLFGVLLYLPFLGERPLRLEEGRRALQAIALLDGASWWRLQVLGWPYVNKPPLLPWLIAGFGMIFGSIHEWAVRLPGVTSVVIGAVSAAAAARRLATQDDARLAALCAGILFLASGQILLGARIGETDTLVTALDGLAFLAWIEARRTERAAFGWWGIVAGCLSATLFAKGPIPAFFVIVPIVGTAVLDRDWRQLAVAVGVIGIAAVPLTVWAALNIGVAGPAHWAEQMRIGVWERDYFLSLLHLKMVPNVVVANVLAIGLAVVWLVQTRDRWLTGNDRLTRALVLYAVPMTLVVLLFPGARARYGMPAVWPLAVLGAAGAVATWRRHSIGVAAVIAAVAFATCAQMVVLFGIEGKTERDRHMRAAAAELARIVPRYDDPIFLLTGRRPDYNLLAYTGRNIRWIPGSWLACTDSGQLLLADRESVETVEQAGGWTRRGAISGGDLTPLERTDRAPATGPCPASWASD